MLKKFFTPEIHDICPNCGWTCAITDVLCPNCGKNLDELFEQLPDSAISSFALPKLNLKNIAFVLLTILLVPLGMFTGGPVALWVTSSMQPHEDWQPLSLPPARVVQILGLCNHEICVETDDGQQYRYNAIDCPQATEKGCWLKTDTITRPTIAHSCIYGLDHEFQFPSPPPGTIQMFGIKTCGDGGDYYEAYALLEDGSVWKWGYLVSDLAGLGKLSVIILGALCGLAIGILIAVTIFISWRTRIISSNAA